jgi:hypothetical protein
MTSNRSGPGAAGTGLGEQGLGQGEQEHYVNAFYKILLVSKHPVQ